MAEIIHSEWWPDASDGALAQMGVEVEARTEEDEVAPHGPLRRRRSHGVQPLRIYRMHHVLPQGTMSSGSSDISATDHLATELEHLALVLSDRNRATAVWRPLLTD